jgi:hypothetical protein
VLAAFAERLEFALRDDEEMDGAFRRLMEADRRTSQPAPERKQ